MKCKVIESMNYGNYYLIYSIIFKFLGYIILFFKYKIVIYTFANSR